MGKKLPEEMAQHRQIFVRGAAQKGVPERKAN
jgi:DNA polymerase III alpha subunit